MSWRNRAACREADPELFFPVGSAGPALVQVERARAVCRGCPVQEACLEWAVRVDERAGIWGGTTPEERTALRRRRARAATGVR
ncbi:WhiB family transcriptional regulator [Streptomyces sp. NPDC001380]|uniref:WhiB family transcriptional regulator n=1 Tax=Streptomyces sp. NPDC001380 TaxID=3364566 RepID=UPI0036A973A0